MNLKIFIVHLVIFREFNFFFFSFFSEASFPRCLRLNRRNRRIPLKLSADYQHVLWPWRTACEHYESVLQKRKTARLRAIVFSISFSNIMIFWGCDWPLWIQVNSVSEDSSSMGCEWRAWRDTVLRKREHYEFYSSVLAPKGIPEGNEVWEMLPIEWAPMKEKSVELWDHGDAEQQFFSICAMPVQLDVCGLVVMSFGDNSGKCKFLFNLLLSDLQF